MNKKSSSNLKTILIYVVGVVLLILVLSHFYSDSSVKKVTYSDIRKEFVNENVESFIVSKNNILTLTLKDKKQVSYRLKDVAYFREDLGELINAQYDADPQILTSFEYEPETAWPWWVVLLPYVAIILILAVVWFFVASQSAGRGGKMNNFGRARVKTVNDTKEKVTFKDVAGADEEKEELAEIVDFLKNPDKYTRLGAKIPHGVLLMGPPGTGKTLLAKAVAGEADVPFLSISGSDFVEMYVGVGASRVRDLFETARKSPASIVFIDEIDAVGRHRGAGLGGGHDEREQTLNQLLVEMDGFGAHDGIIVMAATNRPDILDPALLRPGRFDRQITVNYPDQKGRKEILEVHARNKKFEEDVNLENIAKLTVGFTGADLANLLNEAALLAVRRGKNLIGTDDIEDAMMKVLVGPQKRSVKHPEDELRNTAFHEAGHAVVDYYMPTADPVHLITIVPAGRTLGVTVSRPTQDKNSESRQELNERIAGILGGRVAEILTFGDFTGGASSDIQKATDIARKMVTMLGMSDLLGPIRYGSSHGDDIFLGRDFSSTQDYSDATASKIDDEIHRIITEAFDIAKRTLSEHADKLRFVAEFLLKYETMDGDQFRAAMEADAPSFEEIAAISAEKKRKSAEANAAAVFEAPASDENSNGSDGSDNDNSGNSGNDPTPVDFR